MSGGDLGPGRVGGPGRAVGSDHLDRASSSGERKPENARLRAATRDFEAVFIQQMLKVMRETVPDSGLLDGGSSEDIFSGLLDEHLSTLSAREHSGGLADALYRQFAGRAE